MTAPAPAQYAASAATSGMIATVPKYHDHDISQALYARPATNA